MLGGALYLLGESSVYITNSRFRENIADKRGGAICAESFQTVSITNGCSFNDNDALAETGDALYLTNTLDNVIIKDTKFYSSTNSNFADILDIQNVTIESSSFELSTKIRNAKNKTTGLRLSELKHLVLSNSIFTNIQSSSNLGGGALRIEESDTNKGASN
jgi:predicted outer membrane repeat protein